MATEKQITANRLNAQKSTGPKTPEGKTVVSRNALTHGLLARQAVLTDAKPAKPGTVTYYLSKLRSRHLFYKPL